MCQVENVHLVNLSLANHHHKVLDPANHVKQFGSARLLLTNVTNLSLENGDLTNVQYLISDDPRLPMQCWRVGGGAGADYFDRPGMNEKIANLVNFIFWFNLLPYYMHTMMSRHRDLIYSRLHINRPI